MTSSMTGAQTRRLHSCPAVLSFAAVGGRFEGEGPLRDYFDELSEDHFFGEKTWEKGESTMQRHALARALEKASLHERDLDLIFAGDLLNQAVRCVLHDGREPGPRRDDGRRRVCRSHRGAHVLALLHRRAAVPDACPLRLTAHAHRAVDGHRKRLLPSCR